MRTRRSAKATAVEACRADIYCRISKDDEGDELGVRRQEKLCRELARRLGWEVVGVYTDDNISAFKRAKRRPDFERLCADISSAESTRCSCTTPTGCAVTTCAAWRTSSTC
jgi:hypothetical protein